MRDGKECGSGSRTQQLLLKKFVKIEPHNLRCMYITIYVYREIKIAKCIWKKHFWAFSISTSFCRSRVNADGRPPIFLLQTLLNKYVRKDLVTPEVRQLVLYYGIRNLKRGPDRGDEIDSQFVLVHCTIKYLAGQFKVG